MPVKSAQLPARVRRHGARRTRASDTLSAFGRPPPAENFWPPSDGQRRRTASKHACMTVAEVVRKQARSASTCQRRRYARPSCRHGCGG